MTRPTPDGPSDQLDLALRNHRERGSARSLVSLLRESVRSVRRAGGRVFATTLGLTVISALVSVGQVVVAAIVLDALLAGGPQLHLERVLPPVLSLALLAVAGLALNAAGAQAQRLLGALVVRDTDGRILDVTTRVPLDAYETPAFVDHLVRIQQNALSKPLHLVQAVVGIAFGLVATVGLAVLLVTIEPLLLPMLAVTALPIVLVNRSAGRREFAFATEQAAHLRERLYLGSVLSQRETAKEVRSFDLTELVRDRWDQRYAGYLEGLRALVRRRSVLAVVGSVLSGAALAATLLFLLWQVQRGVVTLAQAGAAVVAMRMVVGRLQSLAGGAGLLFEARLFLTDLDDFLASAPVAPEPVSVSTAHRADRLRSLTVDQVSYRYPGTERAVLEDVSLTISRGEVVALVGENGSGKTTLAKLLAGLHSPGTGTICWNGVPLPVVDPVLVRRRTAVVFQDFTRFQLTAEENIAIGRAHSSLDRDAVRDAARRAGADDVVAALPEGYATTLSKAVPGGVDLSVGQWQRIAVARALYRDADFVVLDEPTSAIDARAEHDLFERMRWMLRGRAALLISHRFSSVRHADRIYVLDGGRIVEQGTHDELMATGGLYAEMFTMQASAYTER